MQVPTAYQTASDLNCVTQLLRMSNNTIGKGDLGKWPKWVASIGRWFRYGVGVTVLDVYNYANVAYSNSSNVMQGGMRAIVLNKETNPGDLLVGPKLLPHWWYQPYTVVAAGPGPDTYDYAIVSGGLPRWTNASSGLCYNDVDTGKLSTQFGKGQGFWLLSRKQVAPQQ